MGAQSLSPTAHPHTNNPQKFLNPCVVCKSRKRLVLSSSLNINVMEIIFLVFVPCDLGIYNYYVWALQILTFHQAHSHLLKENHLIFNFKNIVYLISWKQINNLLIWQIFWMYNILCIFTVTEFDFQLVYMCIKMKILNCVFLSTRAEKSPRVAAVQYRSNALFY